MPTTSLNPSFVTSTVVKKAAPKRPTRDPLDTLIGEYYEIDFTSRDFQQHVAPLSMVRATLSRFYPNERVAVDWEPTDKNRPWSPEAKRRWCHAKRIVYVPVLKTETYLSVEDFAKRLDAEREALFNPTPVQAPQESSLTGEPNTAPVAGLDVVNALCTRPETIVGLTEIAAARVAALPNANRIKGFALKAKRESLTTEALNELQKALHEGEIPSTDESVDAWLAARNV